MKKILFSVVAVAAIVVGYQKYSQSKNMNDLMLANVEALASSESTQESSVAKTESCMLDLGGGYFTASVERVCYKQYVCPSCSCQPKACGEVFYN